MVRQFDVIGGADAGRVESVRAALGWSNQRFARVPGVRRADTGSLLGRRCRAAEPRRGVPDEPVKGGTRRAGAEEIFNTAARRWDTLRSALARHDTMELT